MNHNSLYFIEICSHLFTYQSYSENSTFSEQQFGIIIVCVSKKKELPTGVSKHIYHCPEQYGGEKCGVCLTEEDLFDVASDSKVLIDTDDYLEADFRQECERHIFNPDDIKAADTADACLFLRTNFR